MSNFVAQARVESQAIVSEPGPHDGKVWRPFYVGPGSATGGTMGKRSRYLYRPRQNPRYMLEEARWYNWTGSYDRAEYLIEEIIKLTVKETEDGAAQGCVNQE